MGAWGLRFDQNDDAADWLAEFADEPSWEAVDSALSACSAEYVEAPECSMALAAAEVVAAGLGSPSSDLDEAVLEWATGNSSGAAGRRQAAQVALARIRDDSELNELWQEADEYADWQASVNETLARL